METNQNHSINLVPEALSQYLSSTRLSMEQIAKKWSTSAAMLSQIKNGKRKASLDLGLRILRESGIPADKRQQWMEERQFSNSSELSIVKKELEQKKLVKKLNENFCNQLEENPILLDIFLDIAIAEGRGTSWNSIFKNYGEYGISLISNLLDAKLITFENSRYYINDENNIFITNPETSFGIIKALISKQQYNKKKGVFKGEIQYDISDISKEGYDQLIELNKKYVKEVRKIVDNNQVHRFSGGIRVVCQSLVALAKGALCLLIALNLFTNTSFAGGLRGGSSERSLGGVRGGDSERSVLNNPTQLNNVTRVKKPRDFKLGIDNKFTFIIKNYRSFDLYYDKASAIQAAVELNEQIAKGEVDKELYQKMRFGLSNDCKNTFYNNTVKRAIEKGGIHPLGFDLKETYSPEGQQIYTFESRYYFPCQLTK